MFITPYILNLQEKQKLLSLFAGLFETVNMPETVNSALRNTLRQLGISA